MRGGWGADVGEEDPLGVVLQGRDDGAGTASGTFFARLGGGAESQALGHKFSIVRFARCALNLHLKLWMPIRVVLLVDCWRQLCLLGMPPFSQEILQFG